MAASISFEGVDTDSGTIGGSGSYTFTLTGAAATGKQRLVAVGGIATLTNSPDFTAVTIDGQSATRVGTLSRGADDGGGAHTILTFYLAAGTASTSFNVVATNIAGSVYCGYCALWTLTNADTLLASTSTTGVVTDPTLDVNTATNGIVAAASAGYDSSGATHTWTGLTEDFDSVTVFGADIFSGASAAISSGATPRSISVDTNPNFTKTCASVSVSFNPAVTGTTLAADAGSYALTGSDVSEHFVMPLGAAGE